jgi:hypothetical protein
VVPIDADAIPPPNPGNRLVTLTIADPSTNPDKFTRKPSMVCAQSPVSREMQSYFLLL